MKRFFLAPAAVLILLAVATPASAQGKDPFRPVSGAGSTGVPGSGVANAPAPGGVVERPTTSALPRTGVDLELPLAAAVALLAAGGAMAILGRALA